MKISLWRLLILAISATVLSACGGGGGGSAVLPLPTTATISISTSGTLDPGVMIGGINVSLVLPSGVTVKSTPDALNPSVSVTNPGVVIVSGVTGTNATAPYNTYDVADRKLNIYVIDPGGFGTGEFVKVRCNITLGDTPESSSFGLVDFSPKDINGNDIAGLTAGFTVDVR
jgi:hypothetical protein